MNKTKGILTNVVILLGVFALLFFTQSCGTVAGIGKDIKEKISKKLNDEGGEQNDFAYENTEVKIKDIE